jgi:DegV family protein with EDD domain
MRTAIVTDSTADIPIELAQKHQIEVVPAIVVIAGRSMEDGKDLSRQKFYEQLPTMAIPPTTATPSIGTFENLYEQLLGQGFENIISIHVSSLLSGIYSTAQTAAQSFKDRITVIDSEQLSLGLGFQALTAAETVTAGLSIENAIAKINDVRQRLRVIAMLDTLEYVRRSGRVSWARARIGTLLRIKPFVEIKNGKVHSLGQARTRKKGIVHLVNLIQQLGSLEKFALLHTNAADEAHQIWESLKINTSQPPLIVNVTTVVGTHVGPNGLGFAAVVKE